MKKSIFIGYLSGFLILTNICFAQNNDIKTTDANNTKTSMEQKNSYGVGLSLNYDSKSLQEGLKKNDDIIAKTKEVLQKYKFKNISQSRYSMGITTSSQYQVQTTQESVQFYSYIFFSFDDSSINFNDFITELYSLGWTSINYEEYNQ